MMAPVQPLGADRADLQPPSMRGLVLAGLRAPLFTGLIILVIGTTVWRAFPPTSGFEQATRDIGQLLIPFVVIAMLVVSFVGVGRPGSTIEIVSPVRGRWKALSSPATKVPSHGTHEYGQTWALDILAAPLGSTSPAFGGLRGPMRPEAFPAFGQPIFAGGDGTVVLARDGARDRMSRNSWLLLPLFFVESVFRAIGGQRFVFGNLVVIHLDHGGYQALAHLQRGSVVPSTGDRVSAGEQIGRCGNSGNTTEPHLHVQLMDRPRPTAAVGHPFVMRGIQVERPDDIDETAEIGEPVERDMPGREEHFVA